MAARECRCRVAPALTGNVDPSLERGTTRNAHRRSPLVGHVPVAERRSSSRGPPRSGERHMRRARSFGAAFGAALFALAGCASHRPIPPTDVPAALKVAQGQVLTAALHGTGVQIYECRASTTGPKRLTWVYQSPVADLSDRTGKDVGRHYAGPTWEGYDGSKGSCCVRNPTREKASSGGRSSSNACIRSAA
jgi:hypothetical protein